jgi:lipopolysaccharide biosynthesis glycosyltransferase
MRHKWKKIKDKKKYIKTNDDEQHVVRHVKKCVNCGLLKGNVSTMKYYNVLVYFKEGRLLSTETLPYKCTEIPNGIFLSKKDFYIEG